MLPHARARAHELPRPSPAREAGPAHVVCADSSRTKSSTSAWNSVRTVQFADAGLPGGSRSTLDEHVLSLAVAAGCELIRPAKVVKFELGGAGSNLLELIEERRDAGRYSARWIVDASGRAAIIARKRGYMEAMPEHPVNSLWARFTGVADWDSIALREKFPKWAERDRRGARLGDEPPLRPRLVGVDHPAEGRRRERGSRVR